MQLSHIWMQQLHSEHLRCVKEVFCSLCNPWVFTVVGWPTTQGDCKCPTLLWLWDHLNLVLNRKEQGAFFLLPDAFVHITVWKLQHKRCGLSVPASCGPYKAQQPGFLCPNISVPTVADSSWWYESAGDVQILLWSPSHGNIGTNDIRSVSRAGAGCGNDVNKWVLQR